MLISEEERKVLKQKYPYAKLAKVTNQKGDLLHFVFEPLDRGLMDIAGKEMSNSPNEAMARQMANTCVFGDKNIIINDNYVFRGLLPKWEKIQEAARVELEEL